MWSWLIQHKGEGRKRSACNPKLNYILKAKTYFYGGINNKRRGGLYVEGQLKGG